MKKLWFLDIYQSSDVDGCQCPTCGPTIWVVDGHDDARWLLCCGTACTATAPIPQGFTVVGDYQKYD